MSTLTPPMPPRRKASAPTTSMRSRGRLLTGVVLLVAFVVSTLLQNIALSRHRTLVVNTGAEASISNMNSASLALLLGGLRGPLVMLLWTSSESQKQEKDLEDFDSKIELIRLLQPEFDSVHIFQMWNKAYNISVQMANKANKYATIVDALEYGYKIDLQHPNDLNIISQIGQLFYDKLGSSSEQEYYIDRVRRETFPDVRISMPPDRVPLLQSALSRTALEPARQTTILAQAQHGSFIVDKLTADVLRPTIDGPGIKFEEARTSPFNENGRRIRLDPILDFDGRLTVAAAGAPGAEYTDLQTPVLAWLRQFEPFPYGVSPLGIGNAYYKRGQLLQKDLHQKHLQLSDLVIDNRTAISTKNWAEHEWGEGRFAEMLAFGKEIPAAPNYTEEREKTELPTANVPPTEPVTDPSQARRAIAGYEMVLRIAPVSIAEFNRHAGNYPAAISQFRVHRQSIDAMVAMCIADKAYLSAMLLPPGDPGRAPLLAASAKSYRKATLIYEAQSLEHDSPEDKVMTLVPRGSTLEDFIAGLYHQASEAPPTSITLLDQRVMQMAVYLETHKNEDVHASERIEDQRYMGRAYQRLTLLGAAPK